MGAAGVAVEGGESDEGGGETGILLVEFGDKDGIDGFALVGGDENGWDSCADFPSFGIEEGEAESGMLVESEMGGRSGRGGGSFSLRCKEVREEVLGFEHWGKRLEQKQSEKGKKKENKCEF